MSDRQGRNEGERETGGEDIAAPLARWLLWVDSPAAVERLQKGLYVVCALLVAFEIVWHRHTYVPGEELFGYYAIVGFFAFLLIVLGAKQLRRLIRRDESYYAPSSVDAETYPDESVGGGLERTPAREGEGAAALLRVRNGEVIGSGSTAEKGR